MTGKELLRVLDKLTECTQIRGHNQCKKDCNYCSCHMEWSVMLDALARITNIVSDVTRRSTRKDF